MVEDDPQLREQITRWMQLAGLTIHAVGDGQEALRHLLHSRSRPCVMLAAVELPNIDGLTLRKLLLLQADLARIPFVLMSDGTDGWATRARSVGAVACLQKPFGKSELLRLLTPYFHPAGAALEGPSGC
ncbi:MAG: response regulator [Polyangia bacterium]